MRAKLSLFILTLSFMGLFPLTATLPVFQNNAVIKTEVNQDLYIHSLASLTYYLQEFKEALKINQGFDLSDKNQEDILFSDQDVDHLWNQVGHVIYSAQEMTTAQVKDEFLFQTAYENYLLARTLLLSGEIPKARSLIIRSFNTLSHLWGKAIEQENVIDQGYLAINRIQKAEFRSKSDNTDFENNPAIPHKIKRKLRPHVISNSHPLKAKLDALFFRIRVTMDEKTFKNNGFQIISKRPRSYVYVARNPLFPDYIIKAYMDTEFREKRDRPSWEWLIKRCEGANKVRFIMDKRQIRYFTVASKWIYPLPANPSPPKDSKHTRHLALLVATDMDLAPNGVNLHAWYHYITKEHLDELYCILSRAKGSSYRPDNISYTNQGLFAFIDTEYPTNGPDYKSIRPHLNPEMQKYWDKLVRGGS